MPEAVPDALDELDLEFVDKWVPFLRHVRNYTRLRVDGLEHVPEEGAGLVIANHTGWLGLDYALTALSIYDASGRVVRGMAHPAWFGTSATAKFARKMGIFEVSKDAIRERLGMGDLVMMFPEGEKGAFKPGSDYELEDFARGFVRVAMETGVPVIPVAIVGGEESNPVGRRIESYEELLQLRGGLPIPRNLIPRPVKWRIRILPARDFSGYSPGDADDADLVHEIANEVRDDVQRAIRKLLVERGNPWI